MKYAIIVVLVILVIFAGWFFIIRDTGNDGITNPPTAEEIKRMEEVEKSRSQIDPNAKTGVGVRPVGSIPPEPEPVPEEEATTTEEELLP